MRKATVGCLALLVLAGCSSTRTAGPGTLSEGNKRAAVYKVSFRQVAPQPVYNRLRFVHLPEVTPDRAPPPVDPGLIVPVAHLELKNATLEEASAVLAAISRYSSYCASTIADQRISLTTLGNVDELAHEISEKAGIRVVVDHSNRQVRFLAGLVSESSFQGELEAEAPEPQFVE